jgi:hypothetical protein
MVKARNGMAQIAALMTDSEDNDPDLKERIANRALRSMWWVEGVLLASGVLENGSLM